MHHNWTSENQRQEIFKAAKEKWLLFSNEQQWYWKLSSQQTGYQPEENRILTSKGLKKITV